MFNSQVIIIIITYNPRKNNNIIKAYKRFNKNALF